MTAVDFAVTIPESCAEVLETMFFTSVFEATREAGALPLEAGEVAFGLHFAGEFCGDFGVRMDAATAETLATNFLGDEADDGGVAEAIGELANMLCGSVISRLETKRKFVLSHPRPVASLPTGEDLLVAKLETDSGVLTTWITVSGTEGVRG